jgi:hypothetical protein
LFHQRRGLPRPRPREAHQPCRFQPPELAALDSPTISLTWRIGRPPLCMVVPACRRGAEPCSNPHWRRSGS